MAIYMNNTKLCAEIFSNNFHPGEGDAIVVSRGGRNLEIRYSINPRTKKEVVFTPFDKAVADSVYTIYKNAVNRNPGEEPAFTLNSLLSALIGKKDRKAPSEKQRNEIRKSLEKLQETEIAVDCDEEYWSRGIQTGDKEHKEGAFLQKLLVLERIERKNHDEYHIKGKMPLYEYAEDVKQFICVPDFLFQVPKGSGTGRLSDAVAAFDKMSDTNTVVCLKRALISRLEILRNPKNNQNEPKIAYWRKEKEKEKGLLPKAGIYQNGMGEQEWKARVKKLHDKTIKVILDYYREIGYIYGYEKNWENGFFNGIIISGESVSGSEKTVYVNNPHGLTLFAGHD